MATSHLVPHRDARRPQRAQLHRIQDKIDPGSCSFTTCTLRHACLVPHVCRSVHHRCGTHLVAHEVIQRGYISQMLLRWLGGRIKLSCVATHSQQGLYMGKPQDAMHSMRLSKPSSVN